MDSCIIKTLLTTYTTTISQKWNFFVSGNRDFEGESQHKIHRYTTRTEGFHQYCLFFVNQRRFYESLSDSVGYDNQLPDHSPSPDQVVQFWEALWENNRPRNAQASWVPEKLQEISTLEAIEITQEKVTSAAKTN